MADKLVYNKTLTLQSKQPKNETKIKKAVKEQKNALLAEIAFVSNSVSGPTPGVDIGDKALAKLQRDLSKVNELDEELGLRLDNAQAQIFYNAQKQLNKAIKILTDDNYMAVTNGHQIFGFMILNLAMVILAANPNDLMAAINDEEYMVANSDQAFEVTVDSVLASIKSVLINSHKSRDMEIN